MSGPAALALAGAGALGALGVTLFVAARREGSWATRLRLAGVGTVSAITVLVAGLVCLVVAYQVGVRALGSQTFRVPAWVAVGGGVLAIALSLVTDTIENRRGRSED